MDLYEYEPKIMLFYPAITSDNKLKHLCDEIGKLSLEEFTQLIPTNESSSQDFPRV